MIEKYKKYLVLGYLRFYNPLVYATSNGFAESGPHVEEIWAISKEDAIKAWEIKVIPVGSYVKESFGVEVRELWNDRT